MKTQNSGLRISGRMRREEMCLKKSKPSIFSHIKTTLQNAAHPPDLRVFPFLANPLYL